MTNEQVIEGILEALKHSSDTQMKVELRLHAMQTALIGVLQAIGQQPQLREATAAAISTAAERSHGVALGHPIPDDFLRQRDALLLGLLPMQLQQLVKLPKHD